MGALNTLIAVLFGAFVFVLSGIVLGSIADLLPAGDVFGIVAFIAAAYIALQSIERVMEA
jgi:hypothetical protein